MDIGMIIFYDNKTGEVIANTGQYKDVSKRKTISDWINTYDVLKSRVRESYDYVELTYDQHKEEFSKMTGYRINVKDKSIIFSYQASDGTVIESDKPLIDLVAEMQKELRDYKSAIMELGDLIFMIMPEE